MKQFCSSRMVLVDRIVPVSTGLHLAFDSDPIFNWVKSLIIDSRKDTTSVCFSCV